MIKKYLFFSSLVFILILACSNENTKAKNEKAIFEDKQASFSPDKVTQGKINRLDSLFQYLYKANLFNGNVLVAQKGYVIYQKSFGIADNSKKINLSDSSAFQLASVSKTITAASILKLAETQKLNLNDDVKNYLSEFPYKGVTIEHLITHRSGLPNYLYFCYRYIKDGSLMLTNNNILDVIQEHKPAAYSRPGIRFNYSNTNYMLLALIVEKVSGTSFKDFVKTEIFKPLGMNHTFFIDELDKQNDSVKTLGYTVKMKEVGYDFFDFVMGDKGVYSTTYDMYLFADAYFSGKLISKQWINMAIQPHSKELKTHNYGFGWRMKNFSTPDKMVFHNGWWHGYRTALQRRLKDSTTIVILSNRLNSSVYQTHKILEALDGKVNENDKVGEEEE